MMKMRNRRKMIERKRKLAALKCLNVSKRCFREGLGGDARNAMEKSCEEDGEDGVTMMAGRPDFSVAKGKERSRGAGIRM